MLRKLFQWLQMPVPIKQYVSALQGTSSAGIAKTFIRQNRLINAPNEEDASHDDDYIPMNKMNFYYYLLS